MRTLNSDERLWVYTRYRWCLGDTAAFPPESGVDAMDKSLWQLVDLLLALAGEWEKIPPVQLPMLERKYGLVP